MLALQLLTCWDKLGLPFLDTRLHYNYDNADFSFRARSGNRNGDLRSQFGATLNTYSRWDERTGTPAYYTNAPFLVKALFQQYAKIAGTPEWASRTFYLIVSFAIAAGLYTVLLQTTGGLPAALAGAAMLVSLPLFAVYQTCVKFEADGMLASVWLFVALTSYLRSGSRRALIAYGILTGLAFLVHWTAALFVGTMEAFLLVSLVRGSYPTAKRALLVTLSASAAGIGALVVWMIYLQRGWGPARAVLARAFLKRSASIPLATWWPRQWVHFNKNFSSAFLWLALGLSLLLAGRWLWSKFSGSKISNASAPPSEFLTAFFFSTLCVAILWLFAFRQGSFIHVYWQYWFCFPIVALVALVLGSLRTKPWGPAAGAVASGALVIYLLAAARTAYAGVLEDQLGTTPDIVFLSSLREDRFNRWVFVPVTDTPLNQWFQGPLFEYYTDRAVVIAARRADLRVGDKMLVLRYQQRDEVVEGLAGWSHKRLANEKCGPRLCAYDVLEQ